MNVIDGSYGEGGGQILRYAAALSAALHTEVRVINIRAKRPKPGLRPQHLAGLKIIHRICRGSIEGLHVGSMEVSMNFGEPASGEYECDVGTAGSITLIIQSLMPVLSTAKKDITVTIVGGTDVKWSPTSDYLKYVFLNNLKLIGINSEMEILRRGYYPRGGGKVVLKVYGDDDLKPLNISRSVVEYTGVISIVSNLPKHIAERQVRSFKDLLEKGVPGEKEYNIITLDRDRAFGPGTSILIYSKMENGVYVGGDDIGERGKPAEAVGWNAYQKYMTWYKSKALFDPYMGDMIVPYLFLSKGSSRFSVPKLTKHMESALYVATTLTERKYRIKRLEKAVEIIVD